MTRTLTHLERLEAEAIHIMREVVSESEKPVMLYSVGKDSAVMLHLARKAFFPSPPPFPLLHVDTTWKFQEMYKLRDRMAQESGMELLVYHNQEAMDRGITVISWDSGVAKDGRQMHLNPSSSALIGNTIKLQKPMGKSFRSICLT